MYKYIRGSAEQKGNPGQWADVDLSKLTFAQIFTDYIGAFAVLEIVEVGEVRSLDLWKLPPMIRTVTMTLNDWLIGVGNRTIPLDEVVPVKSKTYATFKDAWVYGFSVAGYNHLISEKATLTQDQIIDLRVSKKDADYSAIDKHCLFTVNGLLHNSFYGVNGIAIPDGARSAKLAGDNRVGIINFNGVSSLTRYPITEDMLVPAAGIPYSSAVYLNLNNLNLQNKTIAISIGGYLHFMDGTYDQVGTSLIKLYFGNYPLVRRYWEMKDTIELPGYNITPWVNRDDKVLWSELSSNENITALLTLPQSFVIVFDSLGMGVDKERIHQVDLAGRYVSYSKPDAPMLSDTGRFMEYTFYAGSDQRWLMRTADYLRHRYMRWTMEYKDNQFVTNHRYTLQQIAKDRLSTRYATDYMEAWFLKLYKIVN